MSDNAPYLVDQASREFPINATTMLGRSPKCDVYIPDTRASRRHAKIEWNGETCALFDLDSANGTWLNGRRITAPHTLRDGDQIEIASAILTFHDPQATFRATDFPLLVVDRASGEIWVNRKPIALSPKEQLLFDLLYQNAGNLVTKQQVAETVWPEYAAEVFDYQIENMVKQLRERLEPDPRKPVLILTMRGRGYKLAAK
jgi:hypothetical protein